MGRRKAATLQGDQFARRVVTWRAVEMLRAHAFESEYPTLRIESPCEQHKEWDDLVEEFYGSDGLRRCDVWQVKRLKASMARADFVKMIEALHRAGDAITTANLALYIPVQVDRVGNITNLSELCLRASSASVDERTLQSTLTRDEEQWWSTLH